MTLLKVPTASEAALSRGGDGGPVEQPPPPDARCLNCDYSLRELSARRCPECGRSFDPADPWSMNISRPYGRVIGAILSPVGWPTIAVALAATAAAFWWTAALPHALLAMIVGLSIWGAIYLYRVIRSIARAVAASVYRCRLRPQRQRTLFILVLLTAVMIWTRFPLHVMFWMHRSAWQKLATHYYEEVPFENPPPAPSRVGLYPIDSIYVSVHGVTVNSRGVTFVYLADGTLPYRPDRVTRLSSAWYVSLESESRALAGPVEYVQWRLERWDLFRSP